MWNKKYRYLPFYESSEEELRKGVQSLVKEHGMPSYPEDTLGYEFFCYPLATWLKTIDYLLNRPDYVLPVSIVILAEELVEIMPGTEPYFFILGVLTELIKNPTGVIKDIYSETNKEWKF